MPLHIIVVDRPEDFPWRAADRVVVSARDYVVEPEGAAPSSSRVINLCHDYSYLSLGYYCSLLAEGRGQKVIPSMEVLADLHWKRLLRIALPEVNELVRATFKVPPEAQPPFTAHVFFRMPDDPRLAEVARRVFELFRCPLLKLELRHRNGWEIAEIEPMSIRDLKPEQMPLFEEALDRYTRAAWRKPRTTPIARYSLAILHDPAERMPPSDTKALEKFVRAGAALGVDVELITKADYSRLLEFDALFIRETTALDHHTYRFAKKAESEGIPVIDDPQSILKCTNKIYLAEILKANNVPAPRTLILDRKRIGRVEAELGFPAVLKIPDSSFSRGVFKVANRAELDAITEPVFKDSDLVIAQEYMQTEFDWRVGVLDRKPIFVCQYFMAKGHWQIVKHSGGNRFVEGAYRALALDAAPPAVIDIASRAAAVIGDGLYGVDLKETAGGVFVVEINDNPNIEAGVEDGVLKDDLYRLIIADFCRRLERRAQTAPRNGRRAAVVGA